MIEKTDRIQKETNEQGATKIKERLRDDNERKRPTEKTENRM